MTIYSSDRTNISRHLLTSWLTGVLILVLIAVISPFLPDWFPFKDTDWVLPVIFFTFGQLWMCTVYDWVKEIRIDTVNRKLFVHYYNIYEGKNSQALPFTELRIKIDRGKKDDSPDVRSIRFLKGNRLEFEISKQKDGFSDETLNSLAFYLELLTRPVET